MGLTTCSGGDEPARRRHLAVAGLFEGTGSGVLLGHDVRSGEAVELPDALRPRGTTVIGKTGTGKSTLLEQLLVEDLPRHTGGRH